MTHSDFDTFYRTHQAQAVRWAVALVGSRAVAEELAQDSLEAVRPRLDRLDNPLKHAPHTAAAVCADQWPHRYSREMAAYPQPGLRERKFWPSVGRIDNPYGDKHLVCSCPPMQAYAEAPAV